MILPVLHSRVVRTRHNPIVAWTQFAVVMWTSHFTRLFDAALEDPLVHVLEHAAVPGVRAAVLVAGRGVDPAPRRLSHPMRIGYLLVGMPFSSFLGLAIFSATSVLYAHYATLARTGASRRSRTSSGRAVIMWAGGDLVFSSPMVLAVGAVAAGRGPARARRPTSLERERLARQRAAGRAGRKPRRR